MDDEAAILLARTHATLVRQLSEVAGHHFEGLQAAARYKSLNLTNRQRRQLCHLDVAFNWSRHVTSVKCATLTAEILKHVSPVPRHALRLLRVHQFKNKMSSPLRRIHRSGRNSPPSNKLCACQSLRYRSKWSCREFQGLRLWSGYRNKLRRLAENPQKRAQQPPVEQIVRVPVRQIQEQVIVQGIPGAQVVKRIRWKRVQQRTVEQIVRVPVPTVQKQMCVPVKSGAQVRERIPEHIVESFDQEELDQLRHDWLMGAFEHPDF